MGIVNVLNWRRMEDLTVVVSTIMNNKTISVTVTGKVCCVYVCCVCACMCVRACVCVCVYNLLMQPCVHVQKNSVFLF